MRALWSSAIKDESQQHHVHSHTPCTNDGPRSPLISFLSPNAAVVLLLCCKDAVLQPPAAGLQNTWDSYSSLAGSMVPLLHIDARCQTWKRAIWNLPPQPTLSHKQNISFSFQLTPVL